MWAWDGNCCLIRDIATSVNIFIFCAPYRTERLFSLVFPYYQIIVYSNIIHVWLLAWLQFSFSWSKTCLDLKVWGWNRSMWIHGVYIDNSFLKSKTGPVNVHGQNLTSFEGLQNKEAWQILGHTLFLAKSISKSRVSYDSTCRSSQKLVWC